MTKSPQHQILHPPSSIFYLRYPMLSPLIILLLASQVAAAPSDSTLERAAFERLTSFQNVHHEQILRSEGSPVRDEFVRMQWDFIERDVIHDPALTGEAYRNLFDLARVDASVDADTLLLIARGLAAHLTDLDVAYAAAPILLSERTTYYAEAEEIARRGLDSVTVRLERDREWFEDPDEFQAARRWHESRIRDALGWIYFQAGNLAEAEEHLLRAHALSEEDPRNLYHLGRLYEARHQEVRHQAAGGAAKAEAYLDRAESFYFAGALVALHEENPNRAALRGLYERRHGSLDGWEEIVDSFEEADRERLRSAILDERLDPPAAAPSFELVGMEGMSLSSQDLAGRVAVLKFWGVWCAWCVKETPEFQRLYERYAEDEDVVILSVNNDADWEEAVRWMQQQDFDFPVLRDDGYVRDEADVFVFPTTWFLDRDGRIAFVKEGWTERLVEEFSWRIEALRYIAP